MTIGTRLKQARKAAHLTQDDLADRTGIKQSTLSDLESGKSAGSTSTATLAHALGVSALWLETGRGPQSVSVAGSDLAYERVVQLLDLFRRADERGRVLILDFAIDQVGGGEAGAATKDKA